MSITIRKYVDITSAIGAGLVVRQRDLILRAFTAAAAQPTDAILEFTDAVSVGKHFGFESGEYTIALRYFAFISKSATRAKRISYSWASAVAVGANIVGGDIKVAWDFVATFIGTTAPGDITVSVITDSGAPEIVSLGDLSAVTSFTALGTAIQTALTAQVPGVMTLSTTGPFYTYQATGPIPDFDISGESDDGKSLMAMLGLSANNRRSVSPGSAGQSPVVSLITSAEADDNFASFRFSIAPTMEEDQAIGLYLAEQNFKFMYLRRSNTKADAVQAFEILGELPGIANHYIPAPNDYVDLLPAALLAATDFTRRAANKNYMYQTQVGVAPSVTDTPESNELDAVRANYYGRTQTAGQKLSFYQRGLLFGGAKDATGINIYVNEIWLKDRALSVLMGLQLNLEALPANTTGRAYVLATLQTPIDEALFNGVISVGKSLVNNPVARMYIQEQTGDELAWLQVQDKGYWIDCQIEELVDDSGAVEFLASYILIYSKGDVVRRIVGSHILI